jgi:amidase
MDWKLYAAQKRNSILELITPEWKLPVPIPSPSEQKDVTGKYVQQFLTSREIEITETDAVGIVQKTTSGAWTAQEVTEAFCHRAALAHQLVSQISFYEVIANMIR